MHQAFHDLIAFERACGHEPTTGPPAIPDRRTAELRQALINEEVNELDVAILDGNLPEIADGIADSIYVLIGTAVRYGIDLPAVWDAVHEANLAKFGPGSSRREDGKLMKPPGWKHPDVAAILANQEPLANYAELWEDMI